jgi:hypothetical protein
MPSPFPKAILDTALNLLLTTRGSITDRLRELFPELDETSAVRLQHLCDEIRRYAHLMFELMLNSRISEEDAYGRIARRYPFLDMAMLKNLNGRLIFQLLH